MVSAQMLADAVSSAVYRQWPVLLEYPEFTTKDLQLVENARIQAKLKEVLQSTGQDWPGFHLPLDAPPVLGEILTRPGHVIKLTSLRDGLRFQFMVESHLEYLEGLKPAKAPKQKQYALRSQNARTRSHTRYRTAQ